MNAISAADWRAMTLLDRARAMSSLPFAEPIRQTGRPVVGREIAEMDGRLFSVVSMDDRRPVWTVERDGSVYRQAWEAM